MTETLRLGRKALTFTTVVATILWSVGFAALVAPLTANGAVTLVDGDLVKPDTLATVYYYKGGKRYIFPNQKTYSTWYSSFSGVKTVPLSEIQNYGLAGNATYRPGTRLVKITTDPKVYAVEPGGTLRWVKTEDIAKALWGTDWAKKVDDVSDAFFTNYKAGSDLASAVYPSGSLVKLGDKTYYIDGSSKREVSAAAFTGNGFNTAYVVTVTDLSSYATGTALGDTEVKDLTLGASATPTPTGGALTISAASDNPTGGSVVVDTTGNQSGQRRAKMLSMNLTAAGGDAMVTGLKATRSGISKDGDIDQVYLEDENGVVLAKSSSVNSGIVNFSSTAGLVTVTGGTTKKVWLTADVNKSASVGSTIGFSVAASGVTLSGGASVSGSAVDGERTVASVTDLGQLEFATTSPLSSTTVDAGKTNYNGAQFKVVAMDQDIYVKKVRFTQIGSIDNDDLQNFKLQIASVQYDTAKALMDNNSLTFDLTKDSAGAVVNGDGLKVLAGQSKFLDLYFDIPGGANRTYKYSIQNSEDLVAWDGNYKVYVPSVSLNTDTFNVETTAQTTINVGTLTISTASDAPTSNVALNGTAVTLGKFTLSAAGEDVKVTALSLYFTGSDTTDVIKNTKLVLDGSQVGSTVASTTALGSGITAAFTFTNNFIVKAGKPSALLVVGDLTDTTIASGSTVYPTLASGSSNAQGLVTLTNISTSQITGNTLTFSTGVPTVVKNAGLADATNTTTASGVKNAKNVKIGSFVIQAGAGEGSKVTQIVIKDDSSSGVAANVFNKMRLQHNGVDLAPETGTLSAANATTYTYSLTTAISMNKGDQYVVDIVADVLSPSDANRNTINSDTDGIMFPSSLSYQTTDTGSSGTVTKATSFLQRVFVATSGTLTLANAGDTPTAAQIVMGKTGVDLMHFKLTADQAENLQVTELDISDSMGTSLVSPTGALINWKLYDGDSQVGSTVSSLDATTANGTTAYAKFPNLTYQVNAGTSKTLKVVADVNASPVTFSNTTHTVAIITDYLTDGSDPVQAKGLSSGTALTVGNGVSGTATAVASSVTGSVQTVLRTKISVAHASDAPSGTSSAAASSTVAKFVVSNTANTNGADANIQLMNVTIGTSISQAAGTNTVRSLGIYKIDTAATNLLAATQFNHNTGMPGLGNTAITAGNFTDVAIASGASQTFTVTLDTQDAASTKTLTVGLGSTGITWDDGFVTVGITTVNTLPLTGKTLSY
ncbi:MAG: hypothetical protein HW383_605 [Candidatus Magasanikbacteria bacterium]|nr:hypothetical protein [Candidatus Magasanikbacteria bacterium]